MKELERLLVFDSEAPPEPGAVFRKCVLDFGTQPAQLFAQLRDVGAEAREVGCDREIAFGTDEESRGFPSR